MIIQTTRPQNYNEYTGTPDKIIEAPNHKQHLVKETEVKFNTFSGWIQSPIYKPLSEVDASNCNEPGIIYHYQPQNARADECGMLKYRLIGATKKKSDKRTLLIVEDTDDGAIFKRVYLEILGGTLTNCGHVYRDTWENWEGCEVGSEYAGYRKSKWIKLDPANFAHLTGTAY